MAVRTGEAGVLIGSLLTTWSIPQSCTVNYEVCTTCSDLFQGQKCVASRDPTNNDSPLQDNYECWPPRNTKVNSPRPHPMVGWGFYSPGLACPTGYKPACTAVYDKRPEWEIQFDLRPGETAIGCCPEGFQCTNRFGNTCLAIATDGTELPTATCSGTNMAGSVLATLTPDSVTMTDPEDTAKMITTERVFSMWAPMFQLNFQSTDVETTTSAPKPGSTTELPAKSTSSSPTESTTTNDSDSNQSASSSGGGGLSTGAAAGIGAGVAVGAISLILLVVFLLWRRRRRHRGGSMHGSIGGSEGPEKYRNAAVGGNGYMRHDERESVWTEGNYEMQTGPQGSAPRSELGESGYQDAAAFGRHYEPHKGGSPHSEMDGTGKPAELGGQVPAELPAAR